MTTSIPTPAELVAHALTVCPRCGGQACPDDEMRWCHECQAIEAARQGLDIAAVVCARDHSPTATAATPAFDIAIHQATVTAETIYRTLADGVLPDGLWDNEERMSRVRDLLAQALIVMGEEVEA